jgi:hypothetical protein
MIRKYALGTLILMLLVNTYIACSAASANTGVMHNWKSLVIENGKIKIVLDCASKASVVSLFVNGRQVVNAPDGMYTAVSIDDKTYSSLHLLGTPSVIQAKGNIIVKNIKYGDREPVISETWTFLKKRNHVVWQIARELSKATLLVASSSPVINFTSIKAWDGAFQGYGGMAWFYLFTEKPSSYGVHSRSSSFWNSTNEGGLDVQVNSPGNEVAMAYKRTAEDRLSYSITVSPREIAPLLDKDTHRRLFIRGDGNVWKPIPAQVRSNTSVTFTYADNNKRYDRGNLVGINSKQVSAVLNTIARIGVIDSLHYGGNSWATPYGPICLHEQYIAQLGLGINDSKYLNGCKAALDFYRDHAIKDDGRVYSRWAYTNEDAAPGQYNEFGFYEAQWGVLMDSNPDFVSNVADLFDLTGDRKWVRRQQQACEKALDWILKRDINHNGLVEMMNSNQDERKSSDWIDVVWASFENGFVNAKLYYALVKWAAVEQVLGNEAKAELYAGFAVKLKSSFNKSTDEGGLWDEQNKCYIHWRDNNNAIHGRNMVTPVNFMAIAYGICDRPERQKQILDAIERQMQQEKLFFWPLTMSSYQPGELRQDQLPFPNYENGDLFLSWGSVGVAAYAKYQPQIALKYVKNVLEQYGKDGLAYQRYSRKDQSGQGDDILAGNSLAIVGLYQSVYGVNPLYNRLYLDPHLTPELAGTALKYHYHNQLLKISLSPDNYMVSNGRVALTSKTRFGYAVTGKEVSYFNQDNAYPAMQVTGSGRMKLVINSWTDKTKSFKVAYPDHKQAAFTYRVAQLQPSARYQLIVNGKKTSNIQSDSKGCIVFTRNASGGSEQMHITPF